MSAALRLGLIIGFGLIAALASPLLAACTSAPSSAGARHTSAVTDPGSSTPVCRRSAASLTWPEGVPADFPKPPGAHLTAVKDLAPTSAGAKHGVVVSLTVPAGLRDEVLYVREMLPRHHFLLGRGDAEPDEADIPFTRNDVTGQLRLRDDGVCTTTWILTVLPRPARRG